MNKNERIVTLLTDFGLKDYYTGAMKGVIASILEKKGINFHIFDLSHEIPPQNITKGSYVWYAAIRFFPPGSVHVGVVDPGVGTKRRIVVAKDEDERIFVCPDNGLISMIYKNLKDVRCFEPDRPDFFLNEISNTFHGRDIFAPLAANIIVYEQEHGEFPFKNRTDPVILDEFGYRVFSDRIEGKILFADHFGNLITSIKMSTFLEKLKTFEKFTMTVKDTVINKVCKNYEEGANEPVFVISGSEGFLEISKTGESAENFLEIKKYPVDVTVKFYS